MRGSNSFRAPYLLFLSVSSLLNTFASPASNLCRPDQREALLEFKSEFRIQKIEFQTRIISYPKKKSWEKRMDCCSWDGVRCDPMSGEVIELDLSCSRLHGRFRSNSSLFKLGNLRVLNLAFNDFDYSPVPVQLGELVRLTKLNLSSSSLSGQIPTQIMHLTQLESLDLTSFWYRSGLSAEHLFLSKLAQNLTNLRELRLDSVDISSEIPQNLLNLTSLRSLHLSGCNLFGKFPGNVLRMLGIRSVRLSNNTNLRGSLPEFHGNSSLETLDLYETSFSGGIPNTIGSLQSLKSLRLSGCNFCGNIPPPLGNLSYLTSVDLSSNNFSGQIPSSFANLNRLVSLDLGDNEFSGDFPLGFLNMTKLSELNLGGNQFTGSLPSNMSVLSNLELLAAHENSFAGTLPSSLFTMPSLTVIYLVGNQLSGLDDFGNMSSSSSKLRQLSLGDNDFNGPIPRSISKLVDLILIELSYWNTGGNAVDLRVFSCLKSLLSIDLSYLNTTTILDLSILSPLNELQDLRLSGNIVDKVKRVPVSQFSYLL
ncbi:PREDICTED: receptor-like protein 12 [Tarenaya hassleriana]|uniref:receptor-like protein 12 n=1 Tax=Tarenaya hassleriana TaxID=28532 RepID=UPI00053C4E08|nr:PREDICTED: receptor-like protein 12 [Tarenaya hassleriana]